jgi:magnesium chelatase subunit D
MKNSDYDHPAFPFTALVGQDKLKLALILNAIQPGIMGVLIRGQKGTAKSTAARSFSYLLPPRRVVRNCRFHCDPDATGARLCHECRAKKENNIELETELIKVPFVTIPINTSEDSLIGSIDFEHALKSGQVNFQPGLLARANRGILYIDEVNLLDDHLVNMLLDVAASGINIIEREGISYSHPSEFILIGTMNPEEGELRPQFLDRFGLCVHVAATSVINKRIEILVRRNAFEEDPVAFREKWSTAESDERQSIERAVKLYGQIKITGENLGRVAQICRSASVAGHRADIVMEKTAKAIAAYAGRTELRDRDIQLAAMMALPHRARDTIQDAIIAEKKAKSNNEGEMPGYEGSGGVQEREELFPGGKKSTMQQDDSGSEQLNMNQDEGQNESEKDYDEDLDQLSNPSGDYKNRISAVGRVIPVSIKSIYHHCTPASKKSSGRRQKSLSLLKRGRYIRATMQRRNNDLAFDATIRTAAPHQRYREKNYLAISIEKQDIREKIRESKTSTLLIFVVDASGSMGLKLMTETKGAVLHLLQEAYEKRDRVCLIAFKGSGSALLLPPTNSVELAKRRLEELPAGGKTPLCAGILQGFKIAKECIRRNNDMMPLLIIITDGRANVGADPRYPQIGRNATHIYEELYHVADTIHEETRLKSIIIDAEERDQCSLGASQRLSMHMGAKYIVLEEIRSSYIASAVRIGMEN